MVKCIDIIALRGHFGLRRCFLYKKVPELLATGNIAWDYLGNACQEVYNLLRMSPKFQCIRTAAPNAYDRNRHGICMITCHRCHI